MSRAGLLKRTLITLLRTGRSLQVYGNPNLSVQFSDDYLHPEQQRAQRCCREAAMATNSPHGIFHVSCLQTLSVQCSFLNGIWSKTKMFE